MQIPPTTVSAKAEIVIVILYLVAVFVGRAYCLFKFLLDTVMETVFAIWFSYSSLKILFFFFFNWLQYDCIWQSGYTKWQIEYRYRHTYCYVYMVSVVGSDATSTTITYHELLSKTNEIILFLASWEFWKCNHKQIQSTEFISCNSNVNSQSKIRETL